MEALPVSIIFYRTHQDDIPLPETTELHRQNGVMPVGRIDGNSLHTTAIEGNPQEIRRDVGGNWRFMKMAATQIVQFW